MTEPQRAVIARLTADLTAVSAYLNRMAGDLATLDRLLAQQPTQQPDQLSAMPQARWYAQPVQVPVATPAASPAATSAQGSSPAQATSAGPWQPSPPEKLRPQGWIGKVLAVAGVVVTLVGVVSLLVLAAQAGVLRPEVRVAAGAALAGVLVATGVWLNRRPGGRVGAVALAATGVAAAYMDVIAVTAIYGWIPAPVGLMVAAVVGAGGLMLARRWDSEPLALLVLVPLIGLAPVITDGVTLLLIGFMLALSAASLPVQFGRDWFWLHVARTAAVTVPVFVALVSASIGGREDLRLALVCALAAVLALAGGVMVSRSTSMPAATAVLSALGTLPLLCVSATADRLLAALLIWALAAAALALAAIGDRLPGTGSAPRRVWSALSAAAALIAVLVVFDGTVAASVLLAMSVVVAVGTRRDQVGRWTAIVFASVGGMFYLDDAPPRILVEATESNGPTAMSVVLGSVLLIGAALAIGWAWSGAIVDGEVRRLLWACGAVVIGYAATVLTVTIGVALGGSDVGFLAGHMAATLSWIAAAALAFGYAARRPSGSRPMLIGGGLILVAAATGKLFLFDLGTLDGMYRVVLFLVGGLVLLGMGAGYARFLAQQSDAQQSGPDHKASST
ncbi:DUF2339 domain-containing protein [Mycolicibacterium goodii]|uniref:DUF2339 domain-containing protein n=1 Tax=Mycolicibacterium goodii TaxID=134601 RepID=UPI001BDC424A|nr:DUF2339 domain-containing protein [Mycolicibacterium goodii]MBU8811647.1 DUF2339 domain-containing protein [Mycolicibacterium goodii]